MKQQNGIIEKTPTSGKHAQSNHVIPITTVRENEEQLFLIPGSMNDNINIDSTIAGSMNDNINMDSTIAESMNDNNIKGGHTNWAQDTE